MKKITSIIKRDSFLLSHRNYISYENYCINTAIDIVFL